MLDAIALCERTVVPSCRALPDRSRHPTTEVGGVRSLPSGSRVWMCHGSMGVPAPVFQIDHLETALERHDAAEGAEAAERVALGIVGDPRTSGPGAARC